MREVGLYKVMGRWLQGGETPAGWAIRAFALRALSANRIELFEFPLTFHNRRSKPMNGDTQIYVSGREYKVPGDLVTYEQVVKIWNELHEAENKHIIGTPGIDYENDLKGEDGILLPGKDVRVKDGTSFSVDPEHVS